MTVYLLHFDKPFHHAKHYVGFSNNLEQRLHRHRNPNGHGHHRLMAAIHAAGIGFQLARVWEDGDLALERRIKRMHCTPRLCPLCTPGADKKSVNMDGRRKKTRILVRP